VEDLEDLRVGRRSGARSGSGSWGEDLGELAATTPGADCPLGSKRGSHLKEVRVELWVGGTVTSVLEACSPVTLACVGEAGFCVCRGLAASCCFTVRARKPLAVITAMRPALSGEDRQVLAGVAHMHPLELRELVWGDRAKVGEQLCRRSYARFLTLG
jgi:hypothetical protein